jgi:hypothetical protein
MAPETREDLELLRDAAHEVAVRFAPREKSKVRFGAKPSGLHDDRLSTKPAPGPRGPSAAELIEEARRRRRERDREDGR